MLTGTRTLEATIYTLRLGPNLHWEPARRWAMSLSAGPAVGIVSGELRFDETLVANGIGVKNSGKFSGTDVVFGGYVSAALMYHAVENGDFYLGAQFMPLGKARVGGGGRQAQLDLAGQLFLSRGSTGRSEL